MAVYLVLIHILYTLWQNLAKDEYESNFVSAVVPPGEIGVKFDDIGALEDVKKALNELVILPMRRPELFSHGNLLRVWHVFLCDIFMKNWSSIMCFLFLCYLFICLIAGHFLSALQRNITFWSSWNWENPSCQGSCYRSGGKLYQRNWFKSYIEGMWNNAAACLHLVNLISSESLWCPDPSILPNVLILTHDYEIYWTTDFLESLSL